MNPVLVTGPATEPIELADAKTHLEVVGTSKDSYIAELIVVARRNIERYLKRALITQTWKVYYRCFEYEMLLPFPPAVSVTHLKYYNVGGVLTPITESDYFTDINSEPARIRKGWDTVWPELQYGKPNAVEIQYVAGYGAASAVPSEIKHAIKLLIADYFDNRGEVVLGTFSQRISGHIKDLIHDYRIYDFAY